MPHLARLALLLASAAALGAAQPATRRAAPPATLWGLHNQLVQFLQDDTLPTWNDLSIAVTEEGIDATGRANLVWEIRSADAKTAIANLPHPLGADDGPSIPSLSTTLRLSPADVQQLAPAGDGDFLAAWTLHHQRVSNVVHVHIDHAAKPSTAPLLRLRLDEPVAPGLSPTLVITAIRPTSADPAFTSIELLLGQLLADGQPHRLPGAGGTGRIGPMAVGETRTVAAPLAAYGITLDKDHPKTLKLHTHNTESPELKATPGSPLATLWDAATP
jgi:hypothetical protein